MKKQLALILSPTDGTPLSKKLPDLETKFRQCVLDNDPIRITTSLHPVVSSEVPIPLGEQFTAALETLESNRRMVLISREQYESPFAWLYIDEERTLVVDQSTLYRVKVEDFHLISSDENGSVDLDEHIPTDMTKGDALRQVVAHVRPFMNLSESVTFAPVSLSNYVLPAEQPLTVKTFCDTMIQQWREKDTKNEERYQLSVTLTKPDAIPIYPSKSFEDPQIEDYDERMRQASYGYTHQPGMLALLPNLAFVTHESIKEDHLAYLMVESRFNRLAWGPFKYALWAALSNITRPHELTTLLDTDDPSIDIVEKLATASELDGSHFFGVSDIDDLITMYHTAPNREMGVYTLTSTHLT